MRCEHKTRPTFPSNARVPQGNFYVSKKNALEGYFVRCKCDVTNYHEMAVKRRIRIPFFFFWPIQKNMHISYINEKRTSCNILQRLSLFQNFARAEPTLSFSHFIRSRRGNLRDVRSRSTAQASESVVRSHKINGSWFLGDLRKFFWFHVR